MIRHPTTRRVFLFRRPGLHGWRAGVARRLCKDSEKREGKTTMKSMAILAGMVLALSAGTGAAQQAGFDSKAFFDELQTRGVSVSSNFDSKAFFDQLSARGVSDAKSLDAKAFFDELSARGVSVPSDFDSKKFFGEIQAKGVAAPSMVVPK